jgi:hypothetical protein
MQISISILVANATSGISYVKRLVKNFKARVLSYPNSIFEAEPCLVATLTELNNIELLRQSSLVITPNAYNEGVLYDVIPNTPLGDMDVVRATTATRVNSAGLIEVVPRNLLGYSQQFNNAYWNKINLSIVPDSITAPNGTLTASTYIPTASPSQLTVNTILKQTANITYTFSFYIKSAGLTDIRCFIWGSTNTNRGEATFNVVNGSVSAIGSVGGFSNTSATINLVNNGYYLCTITTTSDTSAGVNVNFRYDNTISGASGFYIWGAQLEEGSTATEYFPTTTRLNIPRIDYTNGSCPSLLVEPQRTNFYPYSQQLNQWSILGIITVTENNEISPDGTQNADRAQFTASTDLLYRSGTGLAGSNTLTVYAKAKSGTSQKFRFFGNGGLTYSSDQVATNQWQRFTFTYTYSAQTAGLAGATTGASDVLFYGFQHEIGSYPTSYIPTLGASSVTRNADLISKTGVSSLIGTEFTLFFDGFESDGGSSSRYIVLKGSGGLYANLIIIEQTPTNLIAAFINDGSSASVFASYSGQLIAGQRVKLALRCKNNDFAFYVNGQLRNAQTSGTVPTTSSLYLGFYTDYADNYNKINSAIIFNTALTDEQCTLITGDSYNSYAEMANSLNYILE